MQPKFKVGEEVIIRSTSYGSYCFQEGCKVTVKEVSFANGEHLYDCSAEKDVVVLCFYERELLPIKNKTVTKSLQEAVDEVKSLINDNLEHGTFWCSASSQHPLFQKDIVTESEEDIVNQPKHYMLLEGVEVRDVCTAMANRLVDGGYSGIFTSDFVQLLQYILRFDKKNGKEDLEKAKFYLEKMIDAYEKKEG